jgi:hypothetical protein
MSFLSSSLQWHAEAATFATSEIVTYVRGSSSTSVKASRGQSQFDEFPSDMDARVLSRSMDFLIRPGELYLDGSAVTPQRGDQIKTVAGETYDVQPGPDETHWRYSDQHKTFFRIHTVQR